ncbi:hypothetical protein MIND_00393200 [Mycena indigotica]|uniref:Extracellular serine-rich protein n=1 Tax=Mycena indigotica TaxID=2126181 RepID=A0A8H6T4P5_9AGAR|nr:uncharacterized protein MIND_00393200 [Mycena indigotica]KAF7310196.1 hypothetical protein MIND_00393200 [Mycena indigotica]
MSGSSKVLALFSLLALAQAQTTLFGVSVPPGPTSEATRVVISETVSFSALPLGPDGQTTYLEEVVQSFQALVDASDTQVLLSTPITFDFLYAQSTGGFVASEILPPGAPPSASTRFAGTLDDCKFDGHGGAVCVQAFPQVPGVPVPGHTNTVSGVVVPIATLGGTPAASGPGSSGTRPPAPTKSTSGACAQSGANSAVAWMAAIVALSYCIY